MKQNGGDGEAVEAIIAWMVESKLWTTGGA
jgi:hypothetical protein